MFYLTNYTKIYYPDYFIAELDAFINDCDNDQKQILESFKEFILDYNSAKTFTITVTNYSCLYKLYLRL